MIDFLYNIDVGLFTLINSSLQNDAFDLLMPFLTDLNHSWAARIVVFLLWILLLVKGGTQGRVAAVLLIPAIAVSDQLSSSVLKPLVERIRPCAELLDVRLLVDCGKGLSFPSSHAVNNFAGAAVLAHYLPKARWGFYVFASAVAVSRVYVGVHYPSDVIGGGLIGYGIGIVMVLAADGARGWWRTRGSESREQAQEDSPAS